MTPLDHLLYFFFLPFKIGLHLACGEIADPAGQFQTEGLLFRADAETDPLHTARDDEMGTNGRHEAFV